MRQFSSNQRVPVAFCSTCGTARSSSSGSEPYFQSPAVANLLATNIVPTGSHLIEITQKVNDCAIQLAEVDQRIERLQEQLSHLGKQRLQIQRELDDWNVFLHPVRRLPTEILQEIFLACIKDSVSTVHQSTSLNVQNYMPWILAQVCSHWRSAALSFPQLWSAITVSFPRFFDFQSTRHRNWETAFKGQGSNSPLVFTSSCYF